MPETPTTGPRSWYRWVHQPGSKFDECVKEFETGERIPTGRVRPATKEWIYLLREFDIYHRRRSDSAPLTVDEVFWPGTGWVDYRSVGGDPVRAGRDCQRITEAEFRHGARILIEERRRKYPDEANREIALA